MLGLFPVNILVGELGEVPELELYRRNLRRAEIALVIFVMKALAFLEIDQRQGEPRRCIERGKHAVGKVLGTHQVKCVTS